MDNNEEIIRWKEIVHLIQFYTDYNHQIDHNYLRVLINNVIPLTIFERLRIFNPYLYTEIEVTDSEQ